MVQLARLVHNKPQFTTPKPGPMPSFLSEERDISIGTSSRFRHAFKLVREEKPQALGAVKDYFETFAENLKGFDIETKQIDAEQIVERIKEMAPLRDEAVDLIAAIAKYSSELKMYESIHEFFESLIPYLHGRTFNGYTNEWSSDHYRFFIKELFLYTAAALLKHGRFLEINEIIGQGYYMSPSQATNFQGVIATFNKFDTYLRSLDSYYMSKSLRYHSSFARLIQERATRNDLRFEDIVEADFFLYVRDNLDGESNNFFDSWYPATILSDTYRRTPFKVFHKSQSKRFFEKFSPALGGATKESIRQFVNNLKEKNESHSRSSLRAEGVAILCNIENLETMP